MNGRTPTKKEQLYIQSCIKDVGCIACILDGREVENPEVWTEFHHDPDYGSTDPGCHFHGYGLCATHHRGAAPSGAKLSAGIAVRHPAGKPSANFTAKYGTDDELCLESWDRIPQRVKDAIGFDFSLGELPPEVN
jgi:hypothetical protein